MKTYQEFVVEAKVKKFTSAIHWGVILPSGEAHTAINWKGQERLAREHGFASTDHLHQSGGATFDTETSGDPKGSHTFWFAHTGARKHIANYIEKNPKKGEHTIAHEEENGVAAITHHPTARQAVKHLRNADKPKPYPDNWHKSEVALAPEFHAKLEAAHRASFHSSSVPQRSEANAATIGTAFNHIGLVHHLPKEVLDTPIHLMQHLGKNTAAFAHRDADHKNKYHIVFNPTGHPNDRVRTLVHEIQHVADFHAGLDPAKKKSPGPIKNEHQRYQEYLKQTHERRARRAQETGKIIQHKEGRWVE